MAKPTIITRASKGSALTWTEGDTNLTNLRDATIGITDGTTSGTLDLNDTLTFTAGTNVTLSYNSTSKALTINASGGGVTISDDTSTNATRYLVFEDTTSGTVSTVNVASTKLTFNPSTGRLTATELTGSLRSYNEGAIYDLGTTGGTVAPNVANGNVQKITLNSALTLNAFTSPVAGQSLTLIIYGGTAYTSITSTMKFAGGVKTLTGTAGCIDILSVYYDGTTYFASLNKGFA